MIDLPVEADCKLRDLSPTNNLVMQHCFRIHPRSPKRSWFALAGEARP